jgi:hypothetical protein
MQQIQPIVLVHRIPTTGVKRVHRRHPILVYNAVVCGVLVQGGPRKHLGIVEHLFEECMGVVEGDGVRAVGIGELRGEFSNTAVPEGDALGFEVCSGGALGSGQRGTIDGRD